MPALTPLRRNITPLREVHRNDQRQVPRTHLSTSLNLLPLSPTHTILGFRMRLTLAARTRLVYPVLAPWHCHAPTCPHRMWFPGPTSRFPHAWRSNRLFPRTIVPRSSSCPPLCNKSSPLNVWSRARLTSRFSPSATAPPQPCPPQPPPHLHHQRRRRRSSSSSSPRPKHVRRTSPSAMARTCSRSGTRSAAHSP